MPGGDGTGPNGMGGWCTPLLESGQIDRPMAGFGRGRGAWGRGFRWRYYATGMPPRARDVDEKELAKEDVEFFEKRLEEAKTRLDAFKEK